MIWLGCGAPDIRWRYITRTVSGVPGLEKQFRIEPHTNGLVTYRSKSQAFTHSPSLFLQPMLVFKSCVGSSCSLFKDRTIQLPGHSQDIIS